MSQPAGMEVLGKRYSRRAQRKGERTGDRALGGTEANKAHGDEQVQVRLGSTYEDRDEGEQEEWRDGGEGGAGMIGAGDGR